MARDKLITIRIEGDKRQAFGDLAKSQNTDTASLLYDFISQCLDGRIDISLVTGKKQWIDKIDNQLDTNRLDKLETDTQRIDERLGTIAKKLTDWIEAFDDRLNDCDQGLTNRMISLEHRLNTLAIQLDIQRDRQGENPDMRTVATVETVYTVETVDDTVETVDDNVETVTDTVESEDEPVTGEGMNPNQARDYLISKGIEDISYYYLNKWAKDGVIPWRGKKVQKYLTLINKLYYPID